VGVGWCRVFPRTTSLHGTLSVPVGGRRTTANPTPPYTSGSSVQRSPVPLNSHSFRGFLGTFCGGLLVYFQPVPHDALLGPLPLEALLVERVVKRLDVAGAFASQLAERHPTVKQPDACCRRTRLDRAAFLQKGADGILRAEQPGTASKPSRGAPPGPRAASQLLAVGPSQPEPK
jgi:hypothetical protein